MQIKPITPASWPTSLKLITAAFASVAHADGDEADLVVRLRNRPNYLPSGDLGAFDTEGTLIGVAFLSPAQIVGTSQSWPIGVLAPLAVAPIHQNQGIGGALIDAIERAAETAGMRAVSILGDPAYYGRCGYGPASELGLTNPIPDVGPASMIKPLWPDALTGVAGAIQYDAAFGIA